MKKKLKIRTDADMNGYYWEIETKKVGLFRRFSHPFSSRTKAKQDAQRFIETCLVDYEKWPEEYR